MLTTKSKVLIGAFNNRPSNSSTPLSPPHLVPFYIYVFPDPAEKSGAVQLTLRSRDLTLFLDLNGPFNVVSESNIPASYVSSHSHHFRTAPPTLDEYKDDYYSFSALRACAISLGRHDLDELCKLRMDDILGGKYLPVLQKTKTVIPEKYPMQSAFQFHVVNIPTPISVTSMSPRSDHMVSPTESRHAVKEEPSSPPLPPPSALDDERRRPAPMLLSSATHKNIGLAILSPGLPPRATADPDSRKQLVEADAIRAQQQAIIDQRRNQSVNKPSSAATPVTPATAKRPKTLSGSARSTKRARAPPNITIDSSAGKSNPDISIQSAPLYPPRGTLFNKPNGDSGPMTSSLYHSHKDHGTFPYSIPRRRHADSDPRSWNSHNHYAGGGHAADTFKAPTFRASPPRLPSLASQFQSAAPHHPPTPQTPTSSGQIPTKFALRWFDGTPRKPGKRSRSDHDVSPSSPSGDEDDSPMTITLSDLNDQVTMTKAEWIEKGCELLELAWGLMLRREKARKARQMHQQKQQQPGSATLPEHGPIAR